MTLRRLVAKIALKKFHERILSILLPHQLGVGVPGGAEAAVHAVNAYTSESQNTKVILKLDCRNAFNSVRRDLLLRVVKNKVPQLFPLVWQCYREASDLSFYEKNIKSECGVQQGDPLGPALFSLAVSDLVNNLSSELNVWYLDDATLGGSVDVVKADLEKVIQFTTESGIQLNKEKCEITILGGDTQSQESAKGQMLSILQGAKVTEINSLELLGAPVGAGQVPIVLNRKRSELETLCGRLELLHPQAALYLMRHCLGVPKVTYVLRSCPAFEYQQVLESIDQVLRDSLVKIMNVDITDRLWQRVKLPLSLGGWGIRSATDIALSCYAGSLNDFGDRTESLLPTTYRPIIAIYREKALTAFRQSVDPMALPERTPQQVLSSIVYQGQVRSIEESSLLPRDIAIFRAARHPFSSKWLEALPSPHVGTMLDPTSFRMAAALRVGAPVCEPFQCSKCSSSVDSSGLHPLSCPQSQGRRSRHGEINNIIHRALTKSGLPSILEPTGLCVDSGKRPDGLTLTHWGRGKSLVWDATVACTVAASYLNRSAQEMGWVAERADSEKKTKYQELESRFHVVPIAIETLGPISKGTSNFFKDLSKRLAVVSGDAREGTFLRQQISLAVQRGNIASILGAMN